MDITSWMTLAWIVFGTWTLIGVAALYLASKVARALDAAAKQGLTFERVFGLGQASERSACHDAHSHAGHDTGPFQAVR
jgi:hypothetical protein